jgi:hypothetical protein
MIASLTAASLVGEEACDSYYRRVLRDAWDAKYLKSGVAGFAVYEKLDEGDSLQGIYVLKEDAIRFAFCLIADRYEISFYSAEVYIKDLSNGRTVWTNF